MELHNDLNGQRCLRQAAFVLFYWQTVIAEKSFPIKIQKTTGIGHPLRHLGARTAQPRNDIFGMTSGKNTLERHNHAGQATSWI